MELINVWKADTLLSSDMLAYISVKQLPTKPYIFIWFLHIFVDDMSPQEKTILFPLTKCILIRTQVHSYFIKMFHDE